MNNTYEVKKLGLRSDYVAFIQKVQRLLTKVEKLEPYMNDPEQIRKGKEILKSVNSQVERLREWLRETEKNTLYAETWRGIKEYAEKTIEKFDKLHEEFFKEIETNLTCQRCGKILPPGTTPG